MWDFGLGVCGEMGKVAALHWGASFCFSALWGPAGQAGRTQPG